MHYGNNGYGVSSQDIQISKILKFRKSQKQIMFSSILPKKPIVMHTGRHKFYGLAKGQLISECLFDNLKFSKKNNEKFDKFLA